MGKHTWAAAALWVVMATTANANTLFEFSETIDSFDPITFELFGEPFSIGPSPDDLPADISLLVETLPGDSSDRFDLRVSGALSTPNFFFDFDETIEELPTFGLFEVVHPDEGELFAASALEPFAPLLLSIAGDAVEEQLEEALALSQSIDPGLLASTVDVPEPNAFVLLVLGVVGANGRRRAWA